MKADKINKDILELFIQDYIEAKQEYNKSNMAVGYIVHPDKHIKIKREYRRQKELLLKLNLKNGEYFSESYVLVIKNSSIKNEKTALVYTKDSYKKRLKYLAMEKNAKNEIASQTRDL